MGDVDRLLSSRLDRLRLAKQVEQRLADANDERRLSLLDACYDHVNVGTCADVTRHVRGDLRDVHTLLALARGVQLA